MRALCSLICSHSESKDQQGNLAAKPEVSDESGFRHFVDQYASKVQAILYSIFADRETAEEIGVRVFARAYAYSQLPLDRDRWVDLVRLTITECQRVHFSSVLVHRLGPQKDQRRPEDRVRKGTERILELLASLTWNDRVLLILREVADLSPEQIATVLNSTTQRVRADLLRARKALLKVSKA